jgi:hypothetical protein
MTNPDYGSIPTKCNECGKNRFKLTRMQKGQILAECTNCGHAHTLESVLDKNIHQPILFWFTTSKKTKRCVECRSELKLWDVTYDGRMSTRKCEKCALIHTYKKRRFRDWQLIRVTRRADDTIPNPIGQTDLTQIKGIGPKRAITLNLAGINTIPDLAKSTPFVLSSKTGISEKHLEKWIAQAKTNTS